MKYRDIDWTQARCIGIDPIIYYDLPAGEATPHYRKMRELCVVCPIKKSCSDWSLHHEEYGFWSGRSERQRWAARRELNIILDSLPLY
jgi:hypothetical protein